MKKIVYLSVLAASVFSGASALAQKAPTIAVTDLAYEERVQEYFEVANIKHKGAMHANHHSMGASSQTELTYAAGSYSYVEQSELRNFTADLKGAMLKGGGVKLVQSRAFDAGPGRTSKAEETLHQMQTGKAPAKPRKQPSVNDIIARIKKGEFAGADYVLFGSLSNIEFREELSPLQGTSNASYLFSLDLVSDFSLINTRTYEIKASFSAEGSGQDVKLLSSRGDVVAPNRGKVIRETSQSLAESAYSQLVEQLGLTSSMHVGGRAKAASTGTPASPQAQPAEAPVMVFK
jgi:hypothetical protein